MKAPRILALAAALAGAAAAFILHPSSFILAQGPLTPPGAPLPSMKTLDQLEPRTPISSVPFTITQPGSYYLTGNLSTGTGGVTAITIGSSRVTLDLNGFTISSSHPTGSGIGIFVGSGQQSVTIRNGRIHGTTTYAAPTFTPGGFVQGINGSSNDIVVEDIIITGVAGTGISLNNTDNSGTVARRCSVNIANGGGIFASVVESCRVDTVNSTGISAWRVHSSTARTFGTSTSIPGISADHIHASHGIAEAGIGLDAADSASDSTGLSASNVGLRVSNGASNCTGTSNGGSMGLSAGSATNCRGTSVSGSGLSAGSAANCFGISGSGTGLVATTATNCRGSSTSGIGLNANNATNCFGSTNSGPFGIDTNPGTASYCRGLRTAGGTAIDAGIAIGCTVSTGTVSSANKFLGTP